MYLSEQENQLVVSTDNKQEIFVFDHVAHQATSQLDIYRMIGQEAVHTSLEVNIHPPRDITAAFSPTGRLEPAKHTRSWEISITCSQIFIASHGAFYPGSSRISFNLSPFKLHPLSKSLALTLKSITNRYLTWYLWYDLAFFRQKGASD